MSGTPPPRAGLVRRAFTMIELLVVITIITIIVLIALPRFSSLIYAQEEQLAASLLSAAMRTTRDAAIRSPGDSDAAAVFFWRTLPAPSTGGQRSSSSSLSSRLVIVPCVKVGTFTDDPRRVNPSPTQQGSTAVQGIEREVFMAVEGVDPVVLPRNWTIRGYAPPNTVDGSLDLLRSNPADPRANWYEGNRYQSDEGNWLFPETDFYDPAEDRAGDNRQSFMIRFKAGTGEVISVPNKTVVVVDVRAYYDNHDSVLPAGNTKALYDSYDKGAFIKRILHESGPIRQIVLGRDGTDRSARLASDILLVRPVSQLALCDETKLAAALGTTIDGGSGCLYKHPPFIRSSQNIPGQDLNMASSPEFLSAAVDALKINQWIEGDTNFSNLVERAGGGDHPLARLYTLERYTGIPRQMEVQP